jgi:hypothetical protein
VDPVLIYAQTPGSFVERDHVAGGRIVLEHVRRRKSVPASRHHDLKGLTNNGHRLFDGSCGDGPGGGYTSVKGKTVAESLLEKPG